MTITNPNQLPTEFRKLTGIVEANFFQLNKKCPNVFYTFREDIRQAVQEGKLSEKDTDNIFVRMMIKKGQLLFAEIGFLESPAWHLKPDYIWCDGKIIYWDKQKNYS